MSSSRRSYLSVASNNSRSRSRSSTRRGRTSNRDALRKAVLLRNAKKLPHRSEAAFELTAVPQHIRIRRVIQTDMETIRVYTSITVCPRSLIEDQAKFEEAHKSLHQVKQEKMREKEEENKNPVESVCQKVWYSKSMVRVTRDVTISREQLLNNWETSSNEAMVSGFKTLLPDSQQTFSDIYTSSTSKNGEKGYHNKTYMTFAFNQAEGKRQDGHLVEMKNSSPNLEGWCGLDSCVKNYGPVFKLRLSHYMLPNAYLKETSVEETRNYEYNPNSQLTETKSEARTPKLKTPKQEPVTPHKTPSTTGLYQTPPENRSQYLTPEMTTNRSTHAPVKHELPIHPNAIPVPQSLSSSKGVPHLNLDTPQLGKKPSQVFFSDTRRSVSPYTAISPGVKKDSLNEGTSQTPEKKKTTADGEQKHTLILDAEIGGEAHEFEGNITLKTQEKFIPKRVVVDKRTLWERPPPKNDWKSTTTEN